MFIIKRLLLFLFLSSCCISGYAQVGINTEVPDEKSILEIISSDKGILIPRMTEAQRDAIQPTTTNQQSLLIFNTDEDCFNYWHKVDMEWKSICGKIGKANFEISDCNSIAVTGHYLDKTSLGTGHYITVNVVVTKPGTYTITAMPNPENGYYFTLSGEFLATGSYKLIIPGAGTPTNFTPTGGLGDLIQFTLNGILSTCTTRIIIEDSSVKPEYTMNCNSTQVNGVYLLDKPLDNTNTITITINASAAATGATYIMTTEEVGGIRFSAAGTLVAGRQTITLQGTGTPTTLDPIRVTITSNSSISSTTCSATIYVAYTKKRILTIGSDPNGFGYNFSGTAQSGRMLNASNNFGTLASSIIKCEGFEIIDGGANPTNAQMQTWLLGPNPVDIVITGYVNNTIGNTSQGPAFREYLLNGGVVLAFIDNNGTQAQPFLRTVLNDNSISAGNINGAAAGMVYTLSNVNHPILNGPFGDIRGLQWGEDASYTQGATGLPTNDITIFSTDTDISGSNNGSGAVTAFVHNTLNLVYVGDGGFNSSNTINSSPYTICPFRVDANNAPVGRPNWGRSKSFSVYNSVFTANAIAWAINRAQFKTQ